MNNPYAFNTPFAQKPDNNPIPTDLQRQLQTYQSQLKAQSSPAINPGNYHMPNDFHLNLYKSPLKRMYQYTQLPTDVSMPEPNNDPTFQNPNASITNSAPAPAQTGQSKQPNQMETFIKAALNQGIHPQHIADFVAQKTGLKAPAKK